MTIATTKPEDTTPPAAASPAGDAPQKPKTEKELEKERQKAEKLAKFAAKKAKQDAAKATTAGAPAKEAKKEKKPKVEPAAPVEYVEETPKGEKKILKSLDDPAYKSYNPAVVESAWYDWWEKEGFFEPELTADGQIKPEGVFVIPAPPPNVTGALHIGHALTIAIQDTLIRWNRMLGKTVLFVPGFDHAGISTQSVVEKTLWKNEKKTRHDLGREKFTDLVWEWKGDYHARIKHQLKKLGASYDWSREAFTLDDNLSKAVIECFCRLHEDGLLYRANRLVNWCCALTTTLSNLEVENEELAGRTLLSVPGYEEKVEFGVIVSFAYELEDGSAKVIVATTRPETMLGDTAIAVHPEDERYRHLIGKNAKHPFVDRLIPIIADDYVEKDFGTGCVKITPAHDANDYAIGERHKLQFINIMNDDGTLNGECGKFAGMPRFTARKVVVEELTKLGLYVETKDNPMQVPRCSKSKDVIEPIMKPQWWVSQKSMADAALEAVRKGEIKIKPAVQEKEFFNWLEKIQDWCISRQLWWGHQAPAWYVHFDGEAHTGPGAIPERWIVARSEGDAKAQAEKKFPGQAFTLERDPDVLDTWFSSGLWPFSIMGWPEQTPDMTNFYPNTVLETGWDILFFWVARMIMLGIKMTGSVPFTEVFCHSLVRDSEGRKMSKSLGNVIDPLDIISGVPLQALHDKLHQGNLDPKEVERAIQYQKTAFPDGIPQCGSDAMHFAFCHYTTGGRDINMDIKVVDGYRKFCNKMYQATKFALMRLGDDYTPPANKGLSGKESLVELWILHKFNQAAKDTNRYLEERDFSKATDAVYQYWLYELCDVYIENSKPLILEGTAEQKRSAQDTLYTCLEGALLLIHPFTPYVTEELWQRLPRRPEDKTQTVCKAAYPVYNESFDNAQAAADYDLVFDAIKAVRSLMAEYNIKDKAEVYIHAKAAEVVATFTEQQSSITALTKGLESIKVVSEAEQLPEGLTANVISDKATVYLMVKGRVDVDAEISKAQKKIGALEASQKKLQKAMSVNDYKQKVKEEVQQADAKKLVDLGDEMSTLKELIAKFEGLRA
ncbi:tRNA synthetases class I-domain-containing protein [Pyronema domesticum]|uniref:Valine--tRNA ligase, mitochondrial n=1 Tax=Pyronema omphalodes (strain CBS 100304) TaxID=1076935 RepID=U4LWE4_PYROM|nr:tRNA synthetases class I-domain-containing protein [Pyronema domesticum]CCX33651.1 Similar to Valine--tRNA ligase, mitochondrial; acc. no. P07806 [Pyronema omphalodes CBS 100304]